MRIRVNVKGDATPQDPHRIELPEYNVILDTEDPEPGAWGKTGTSNFTIEAEVPDRILDDESHRPSVDKVRALYKGNPVWDRDDLTLDV